MPPPHCGPATGHCVTQAHAHPLPGPLHPSSPLPRDKQPRPPVVLPPAGSSPARLAGTPHGSLLSWNLAFGNLASSAGSSIGWAYEQVAPLPMRLKITVSPLKFVGHVTKALSASLCSSSSSADGERPAAAGWMQMVLTLLLLKRPYLGNLNLRFFYIKNVVAQVLVYSWLFLKISHKMLAENPNSLAP